MNSIFIFRRDLRLYDNTGLIEALKSSRSVLCCFIFDPNQAEGDYFSSNAFEFMINSLKELREEIKSRGGKLYFFKGKPKEVINKLLSKRFGSVYVNKDYTPFSHKRDSGIRTVCKKNEAEFFEFDDYLLNPPGSVLKDNGEPYTVFTPFYNKAKSLDVRVPVSNEFSNYFDRDVGFDIELEEITYSKNESLAVKGKRSEGLELLEKAKSLMNYKDIRNFPSIKGTSMLSAHNKFGTLSVRECYYSLKDINETLISEFYWRDFFTHVAYFFPEVFGRSFKEKYDELDWGFDKELVDAWREGKTGFPIVDAGMRELNTTGFMHNRVRMITANFLTKLLFVDWRVGEKYFASKLVDYDPCVNNGNWQWSSSTGCDAQPYFRIFNPWSQQEKFDKDCEYIKKWVEELRDVDAKVIHNIFDEEVSGYNKPIIDYKESRQYALEQFKKL